MKKSISLLVLLCMVAIFVMSACTPESAAQPPAGQSPAAGSGEDEQAAGEETAPVKMAIVTNSSRADGCWSQSVYEGYLKLAEEYPDVEFTFVDSLSSTDAPTLLTQQCEAGYNVIYIVSALYTAIAEVAPMYPDTWFVIPGITEDRIGDLPSNCICIYEQYEESGYLSGVAAGLTTKTNKIACVVGQVGYPNVSALCYGFYEGAKSVNPAVEVLIAVTSDWVDVQKGYDCACAVIDAGADVILQHADDAGVGVIKACQEYDVYCVGEARDQSDQAPDIMLTSQIVLHAEMMGWGLTTYLDGTIGEVAYTEFGIEQGDRIAPLADWASDEAKQAVEKDMAAMKAGTLAPTRQTDSSVIDDLMSLL